MPQNQEPKSPDNSQNSINVFDLQVNGQNFPQLDTLPPEIKAKVEQAFAKLQSNPNLMNMLKGIYDMAKTSHPSVHVLKANLEGQIKTSNAPQEVLTASTLTGSEAQPASNTVTFASSHGNRNTFNSQQKFNSQISPVSNSGSQIRNILFLLAILAFTTYIIAKFVLKMNF